MTTEIWTDGACSQRGNSGRGSGGWAAILKDDEGKREICGHESETTNQRMELLGAIHALNDLQRPSDVVLYSDSAYLINAMTQGWIEKWKANGWKTSSKKPVKNRGLWMLLTEASSVHNIEWIKVKGHTGNENNNRVDSLAQMMSLTENIAG